MVIYLFQAADAPSQYTFHDEAVVISTVVIALAAIINLVVSTLLWRETRSYSKTTRDMFEASHRPYVGVHRIQFTNDESQRKITIRAEIHNKGSVPAQRVEYEVKVVANGFPLPVIMAEHKPSLIFPGTPAFNTSHITDAKEYRDTISMPIDFFLSVHYEGVANRKYSYEGQWMHRPGENCFVVLGATST